MAVLETILVYYIGCLYGIYISIRLLIAYVKDPSVFNLKERNNPPKCLDDPALGTHGYLSLKDVKIHYVEKGDRSKPLMLFVHGFPEFWYSWRYQLKEFSKDYWTVAIDMRGYGDSGKPTGRKRYAMKYLVNDIKEAVEAFGRQKFTLVAHDWGGVVAWCFVKEYPEMVENYIIMDAPYTPAFGKLIKSNKKQFFASWYIFMYQLPCLAELMVRAADFSAFQRVFKSKRSKIPPTVTDEDIEAFKYTFCKPKALTPPINYYRANLESFDNPKKLNLDIDAQGLFMLGELDDYIVSENMDIAKKYVKNLTIKVVKGANHFLQQDEPEMVNKYMREFLNSLK